MSRITEPTPPGQVARRRRVSRGDVAVRAGVSHGTVSHVRNHPDRVRPAARERVEAAIRELGFVRDERFTVYTGEVRGEA